MARRRRPAYADTYIDGIAPEEIVAIGDDADGVAQILEQILGAVTPAA